MFLVGITARRHACDCIIGIAVAGYLIHMSLLYTVVAAVYLQLGHPPTALALALWTTIFIATATATAWLMTVGVDEPAVRLFRVRKKRT